ncbi:MAG: protein kinase [Planctomycetes bacterium]|nr:protein kinase [Planctomycetota bacterium]
MIRLNVIRNGESVPHIFQGATVLIGRSRGCDLSLREEGGISRQHCRLTLGDEGIRLEDLKSTNGIVVNDRPSYGGPLEVGDEIRLGAVTIELVSFGPDEAEPVQVRPCSRCGQLVPIDRPECPRCDRRISLPKLKKLDRRQLPGYLLKRRLGAGGMGVVFEAERQEDGQTCAIKILKPHLARNPAYLMRFVEETRVLTMLRHPQIVQIYGRGAEGDLSFIDMEYVAGESVRHLIRADGRLAERRALQVVWEMVGALDFAAKQKVIHGDVKPSNFLLDDRGGVKLCDFGLSRLFNFTNPALPGFAAGSSTRKGTAAYAAPERFLADSQPTIVADIYSMGVSLYQMLTGELPFGTNAVARKAKNRTDIPRLDDLGADVRPATAMLVERMLAPTPDDRYQSYRELQDDLAVLI